MRPLRALESPRQVRVPLAQVDAWMDCSRERPRTAFAGSHALMWASQQLSQWRSSIPLFRSLRVGACPARFGRHQKNIESPPRPHMERQTFLDLRNLRSGELQNRRAAGAPIAQRKPNYAGGTARFGHPSTPNRRQLSQRLFCASRSASRSKSSETFAASAPSSSGTSTRKASTTRSEPPLFHTSCS